jgi:hypothetical protein
MCSGPEVVEQSRNLQPENSQECESKGIIKIDRASLLNEGGEEQSRVSEADHFISKQAQHPENAQGGTA